MRSPSPPGVTPLTSSDPTAGDAPLPPEFDGRLSPLDAAVTEASPAVETRWVPLVPATSGGEWSARSGAFLMLATRADEPSVDAPTPPAPVAAGPPPPGVDLRTALVSCLEAILPELEPGWSHCADHARCRAVQEASAVLWGSGGSGPAPPMDDRATALGARAPVPPDAALAPIVLPGDLELLPRAPAAQLGP